MNLLKRHSCYLAGPIDKSQDFGTGWRRDITEFCHSVGIGTFDPTDKPSLEGNEDSVLVSKINKLKEEDRWDEAEELAKAMISIDLHYVDISNFTILYMDLDAYSCGTFIESSYAALEKKPILVTCKQGKENIPNSLLGICTPELYFNDFEEMKEFISSIDSGKKNHRKFRLIDYDKVFGY